MSNQEAGCVTIEVTSPTGEREPGAIVNRQSFDFGRSDFGGIEGDEVSLMYARHNRIPLKDFEKEIKTKSIQNIINNATVILDISQSNLPAISKKMISEVFPDSQELVHKATETLFTHDSVQCLAKTIQCTTATDGGGFDYDQSWICAISSLPDLEEPQVIISRLKHTANLGPTSQEVKYVILVLVKENENKLALEIGRTFATMFSDIEFRQALQAVQTEVEFKNVMWDHAIHIAEVQSGFDAQKLVSKTMLPVDLGKFYVGRGVISDFKRRLPFYLSDFKDGFVGHNTIPKLISATMFLYFACLLPSIAFGVLNHNNTYGCIGVKKVVYSQLIGGLAFSLLGGQPLIVLLTTAPLALYTKLIFVISTNFDIDFFAMYACVGLWMCFFLFLYSIFDLSQLMNWSTRSTEEIFAVFVSIAFLVETAKDIAQNFQVNYESCHNSNVSINITYHTGHVLPIGCHRENSILFVLLILLTLFMGVYLYNFTKTPFLTAGKREMLADYALPVACLTAAFIGSYVFRDVKLIPFGYDDTDVFVIPQFSKLTVGPVFAAMGLAFPLSLLFFMDQNITSAMVNGPSSKLKKGSAYHWDMLMVAVINGVLSLFALPWVHGALPHSPLHLRALADVEERVDQGHVYQIVVKVRETRVSSLVSHVLIGFSVLLLPYPLAYIPKAVLDGLFLYIAVTALNGNQLFDRMTLFFTDQAAYPPNHYIRNVPYKQIQLFTLAQVLQLAVLCAFGFSPIAYMKMGFPIIIALMLPIRHKLIPKMIDEKNLEVMDGHIY